MAVLFLCMCSTFIHLHEERQPNKLANIRVPPHPHASSKDLCAAWKILKGANVALKREL